MNKASRQTSYDVVIPYHQKDRPVVKYCLEGCMENLEPRNIFIITNPTENKIEDFGNYQRLSIVDEDSFFEDLSVNRIIKIWLKKNWRLVHKTSKWLYQQLVKMACCYKLRGLAENYLVLDSDTVFLKKTKMIEKAKALMCRGDEYHRPYFSMINRLLGIKANREYSFIVHHQLVNKGLMKKLLKRIAGSNQKNWQRKWHKRILREYDYNQKNGFSEYETYGHFLKHFYPDSFKLRDLKWRNCKELPSGKLLKGFSKKYDFVSFHTSHRQKRLKLFGHIDRIKFFFNNLPAVFSKSFS